jgi:hypothetical protein
LICSPQHIVFKENFNHITNARYYFADLLCRAPAKVGSSAAADNATVIFQELSREQKSRIRVYSPVEMRMRQDNTMLGTILLIILILLLIGALPNWGYSRGWGYGPSGGLGLVLVIIIILVLMGRI